MLFSKQLLYNVRTTMLRTVCHTDLITLMSHMQV